MPRPFAMVSIASTAPMILLAGMTEKITTAKDARHRIPAVVILPKYTPEGKRTLCEKRSSIQSKLARYPYSER
jgi:hypothetical protein